MYKNIFILILPVLLLIAGCGGPVSTQYQQPMQQIFFAYDPCTNSWVPISPNPAFAQQQIPNEQHIYYHNDTDDTMNWYILQQMRRQNTQDFIDQTDDTMDSMDESIRRMRHNNRDTLGILEDAQRQQQLYEQQRRENMRRAYSR